MPSVYTILTCHDPGIQKERPSNIPGWRSSDHAARNLRKSHGHVAGSTHLLGLMLMLPGHATFRNLSRYRPYHEKTFARQYDTDFDWVSLNKVAITQVVPAEHDQALVMDASFMAKSGKQIYGLDRFWNGSHSRTEKGLGISTLV